MTRKPKTAAERMREKRARDKLREEERLAKLLAKTIKLQLYHSTNHDLNLIMLDHEIYEPQDAISRLISGYKYLTEEQKSQIFSQSGDRSQ